MISIPHGAGEFTATCRDSGDGIRGRSLTAGLQALLTAGYVPIDDHVVPSGPRLTSWRRRAVWPDTHAQQVSAENALATLRTWAGSWAGSTSWPS